VDLIEESWPEGRQRMEGMQRLLDHATALPQQLLAFAREAGPERREVELHGLLRGLEGLLRGRAAKSGCALEYRLEAADARVEGDEVQLRQAFLNLAGNALDAMGTGGRLTIGTERREGVVEVSVADTGPGMTQEVLARAFERMYTTRTEGTGLGLMVVGEVARRHGGRISCQSAPGQGARFVLELPASRVKASGETRPGRPRMLAVVEPKPEIARLAGIILGQGGSVVCGYASLEEARLEGGRLDGVVVDASLLDEAGAKVLEQWLAEQPAAWLVVTTAGTTPTLSAGCRARLRGVVSKPYTAEELRRVTG
jgi:hypothetical protein